MAIADMIRLFRGGVMTGTNVLLSGWIDMARIEKLSIELGWTGAGVTGAFTLEGTNRPDPSNPTQPDPNATAVTLVAGAITPALPVPAGPATYMGGVVIANAQAQCRWIRLRYVNATNSGVLDGFAHRSGPT